MNIFEIMTELAACTRPSPGAMPQAELLRGLVKPYVDEISLDATGNLICRKKGPGRRLMISASMDVTGFIVRYIDKRGFIRFMPSGGFAPAYLPGTPLRFEQGAAGCIMSSDQMDMEQPFFAAEYHELYIDIGAKDEQEAAKLVAVGETAIFAAPPAPALNNSVIAPNAGGFAACITLLLALEELAEQHSANDLYVVFTSWEEWGLPGAKGAARQIQPEMSLAVERAVAKNTPGETIKLGAKPGQGPVIRSQDNAHLCSPAAVRFLRQAAEGLAYQDEVATSGAASSAHIQQQGGGVLAAVLGIPCRNPLTQGEIISLADVELAGRVLARAACQEL